jgi:plastocyanin domain-containing protein
MGHVSPPVDRSQLDAQAVSAVVGAEGVQTLDFVVNGDNMAYRPNVVKVRKDVPMRLNISTEGRDPGCGRFVGFKGLGAHAIAEPGQTVTMDFTPTQAGVYEINCNMDMMVPGYLIVE